MRRKFLCCYRNAVPTQRRTVLSTAQISGDRVSGAVASAVASEILSEPILAIIPLPGRQVLAALAVLTGLVAAFWRRDGKSVGTWLRVVVRFRRLPHRAISRPAPVSVSEGPDHRWYEVRPPLAWHDEPARGRIQGARQ